MRRKISQRLYESIHIEFCVCAIVKVLNLLILRILTAEQIWFSKR